MPQQNPNLKEKSSGQKFAPSLVQGFLIVVNLFIVITQFANPLYWLAIIKEVQDFVRVVSYQKFKQKIIQSEAFNLKVKSFLEIFLIFTLGLFLWGLYSSFTNLAEDFEMQWQFLLAAGLLNSGIKIFISASTSKEGFHSDLVRQNLIWILTAVVALGLFLIPNLDYYFAFLLVILFLFQAVQRFNYNINSFQPPVKTIEVPVQVEVEKPVKEEPKQPSIEIFDISDEVLMRLKKIQKVKYIHNTLVCKIKEGQEIVTATLVVDNTSTQEEIFDIKKKAKKLFKKLDFMRSVVEIEYEAEYKGLV